MKQKSKFDVRAIKDIENYYSNRVQRWQRTIDRIEKLGATKKEYKDIVDKELEGIRTELNLSKGTPIKLPSSLGKKDAMSMIDYIGRLENPEDKMKYKAESFNKKHGTSLDANQMITLEKELRINNTQQNIDYFDQNYNSVMEVIEVFDKTGATGKDLEKEVYKVEKGNTVYANQLQKKVSPEFFENLKKKETTVKKPSPRKRGRTHNGNSKAKRRK